MGKAYSEFIQNRCEEILQNDDDCKKVNSKIVKIETIIKKRLKGKALKLYIKQLDLHVKLESSLINKVFTDIK